jgi:curved DNA-binding protein CbpA
MPKFVFFIGTFVNLSEVRLAYYTLAKTHHPDVGGDTETMKLINIEYEKLSALVLSSPVYAEYSQSGKDREMNVGKEVQEVINKIITIKMPGCTIEVLGNWVWVSGNTRPIKDALKFHGFFFSKNKLSWYWHPDDYKKNNGKKYDLDQIRTMWPSKKFDDTDRTNYLG